MISNEKFLRVKFMSPLTSLKMTLAKTRFLPKTSLMMASSTRNKKGLKNLCDIVYPHTKFELYNTSGLGVTTSFEPDIALCSVSVIPLQHKSCSVCMYFVGLSHHNK